MCAAREVSRFSVPTCDVVEHATRLAKDACTILLLLIRQIGIPDERRVAHHVVDLARRDDLVPIHAKSVVLVDGVILTQWQRIVGTFDNFFGVDIGLFLGYPKRCTCHTAGKIVYLNTMEVGKRHFNKTFPGIRVHKVDTCLTVCNTLFAHCLSRLKLNENTVLKSPKANVCLSKEVATTACWVKERKASQLIMVGM